jgi:hypothetical protein
MTTSPRVTEFLAALNHVDGDAFCTPPGLGAGWRIKHVRIGLERHVLCIHSSGQILAFTPYSLRHGACEACSSRKGAICTHCSCGHCAFDALCAEHSGPKATKEQVVRLLAKLKNFELGRRAPVVALDD